MGIQRWALAAGREGMQSFLGSGKVENFLKIFAIFSIIGISAAFNIAPKATYIGSLPQRGLGLDKESYFGYAVEILQNNLTTWLLVGAPKANSEGSQGVEEPGALFKCPVFSKYEKNCSEIILDTSRNFEPHSDLIWTTPFRNKSWTGAALDIDVKGNVVVCAPRWKNIPRKWRTGRTLLKEYRINGLCYILGNDLKSNSAVPFSPTLDVNNHIYNYYGKGVHFYAHGQCGYDVHFTKNNELLLGCPGVLIWQGSVAKYVRQHELPVGGISKREASEFYDNYLVPNPIHTSDIQDFNYFGFSVTSGKFDAKRDLYYVAGAPRASGFGKVFVFLMRKFSSQKLYIKETKQGSQMGEYFGASVVAPDLNGDGFNDLVVGAPLHSVQDSYDVGCIYVYMNTLGGFGGKDRKLTTESIQLFGDIQGRSRFGTSLGTPGDLDKDGYEDIVVGAPHENEGRGAIYVFMGSSTGIRGHFSQKLTPEKAKPVGSLRGFGISFSKPHDVDGNSYPDFAVGSYLSDEVLLMQTRPVIIAKGEILSQPPKLSLENRYFVALPCIEFGGAGVPAETVFEARVTLQQESATGEVLTSFTDGSTEMIVDVIGYRNSRECVNLQVNYQIDRSDAKPITIRMDFSLKNEKSGPENPILSPYTDSPAPLLLSFITGCPGDVCTSDLRTFAKFEGFDSRGILEVGQVAKLTLQVEVTNWKDPAFLPNVTINVTLPILVLPSLQDCSVTPLPFHSEVVCQLDNPLRKSEKAMVQLELDISGLDDTSSDIKIDLLADSAADRELNSDDNAFELGLRVNKTASLKVTGWSKPEQFYYERKSENKLEKADIVKIQHVFSIEKSGITPLKAASITVVIPTDIIPSKGAKQMLLQITENELTFHGKSHTCQQENKIKEKEILEEEEEHEMSFNEYPSVLPTTWDCSQENINCATIKCNIGPWKKAYDVASLTVSLQLNLTNLASIIPVKHGFTLSSFVEVKIPNAKSNKLIGQRYDNATVQTIFVPGILPAQPIQLWVYLLAVLGGILLFIIIAYILYKVGFFRRKKYEELQAQQARVTSQEATPALQH